MFKYTIKVYYLWKVHCRVYLCSISVNPSKRSKKYVMKKFRWELPTRRVHFVIPNRDKIRYKPYMVNNHRKLRTSADCKLNYFELHFLRCILQTFMLLKTKLRKGGKQTTLKYTKITFYISKWGTTWFFTSSAINVRQSTCFPWKLLVEKLNSTEREFLKIPPWQQNSIVDCSLSPLTRLLRAQY